ncbi:MAG: hypothetical protein U1F42_09480 [Candidatus Competibacteraceae bacterium]
MRSTILSLRNLGIYLLPTLLLATVGLLLTALLYDPVPSATPIGGFQTATAITDQDTAITDQDREYWQAHAEAVFAALLMDALRQPQTEQAPLVQTLVYQHEYKITPTEQPRLLRAAPLLIENNGSSGHPTLIRL